MTLWCVDRAPQANILTIWSHHNVIFLAKTAFLKRFSKEKQQNSEQKTHFLKNAPLVTDPGVTRGGFLKFTFQVRLGSYQFDIIRRVLCFWPAAGGKF